MITSCFTRAAKQYSKDHLWFDLANKVGKFGVTSYKGYHLGNIKFLALAPEGTYKKGEELATIESDKTIESIAAPVDLKITQTNTKLEDNPKLLKTSAEKNAWIAQIEILSDFSEPLVDRKAYLKSLE
ncbi:Glycine cleavage H-protein [Trichomonas vaginalis G3]|uniref:Glycine cleavage H-protein n=1 Tax=Trichomonas vaginalis (strain ATCC PRA-98 / G3) TaxID=412133 RepID=A2ENN2_TRIV3|nr:glycine decarboxylation via glycine cleavage system [Trichomonas vaginalis G3]EAY05732.1 Glycine cleavage H-protein [Trichomonas vaginalis G3]KAI5535160.1 glycine decarboxylation via glycine cleavage system [Trichomonas vaginalis G3]|eukprot:XP_001317955.1 Glycine cleavage H-protein [Trichomonas vaginalis G3]